MLCNQTTSITPEKKVWILEKIKQYLKLRLQTQIRPFGSILVFKYLFHKIATNSKTNTLSCCTLDRPCQTSRAARCS